MPECDCKLCVSACENVPGLFTPVEVAKAVSLGLAKKLCITVDFLPIEKRYIQTIRPRCRGEERDWNPCIFLKDNRCQLHASGIKPAECSLYHHDLTNTQVMSNHLNIAHEWATPFGLKVRRLWAVAKNMKKLKEVKNDSGLFAATAE